eukprot:UN00120
MEYQNLITNMYIVKSLIF